jgi:hypothetical protein
MKCLKKVCILFGRMMGRRMSLREGNEKYDGLL